MTRSVLVPVVIALVEAGLAAGQTLPMPAQTHVLIAPSRAAFADNPDPNLPTASVESGPPFPVQVAPAVPLAETFGPPGVCPRRSCNSGTDLGDTPFGPLNGRPWTGPGVAAEPLPGEPAYPTRYHTWADLEYLLWWEKKQPLPPDLIMTGSALDPRPGALGQPSTQTLFGPREVGYDGLPGFRGRAGCWLDGQDLNGVEASGFVLGTHPVSTGFSSRPNSGPLLALNARDPASGAPTAFVIAAPSASGGKVGPFAGTVLFGTRSQLWGAGTDVLRALYSSSFLHLYASAGFRYLDLHEAIDIDTSTTATQTSATTFAPVSFLGSSFGVGSIPMLAVNSSSMTTNSSMTTSTTKITDGTTTATNTTMMTNTATTSNTATTTNVPTPASVQTGDRFQTHNQFYGGQLGLRGECVFDRWFLAANGTLALGETQTVLDVAGVSVLNNPFSLAKQRAAGGLYALPSNSGRFFSHDFAVVPEVQVKGGVLVTSWFKASVGYDFLYWSRVLRPGDQIDLNIDSRQVPTSPSFKPGTGAVSPRPMMNHTGFWAQGLTVGLEFAY